MRHINYGAFFTESSIFLSIQFLALFVGWKLLEKLKPLAIMETISITEFLVAFVIATAILLLTIKFIKHRMVFKLLFIFLIVIGSKIVFESIFPSLFAGILAVLVLLAWLMVPTILTQNIAMIFTIAGISASVGVALAVPVILIMLAILSIYDVIAVYKTGHMVKMFKNLLKKGVMLAIVVPAKLTDVHQRISDITPGKGVMMLGTGDIAFPAMFAVAVLRISWVASIGVILGSWVGLFIIYILLTAQRERKPMPALPPIALCSLLGFLASILLI
jgi:presenilin-like A22 family membrane protease